MKNYLVHHGILGQKWGVRRYQNPDGTLTAKGKERNKYSENDTVFISGKVRFDKPIPRKVRKEIDKMIKANANIIIGDAPGADKRVQDYIAKKRYQKVEVFTTDDNVRNNVGEWKVNKVDGSKYSTEKEIRRQKDIAMTNKATKGYAIRSPKDDNPNSATYLNIQRLIDKGIDVDEYDYISKKVNTYRGKK